MKNLSKFTKVTLGIGLLLVVYGYVCRATELKFFWESKSIGWALFLIGLIGFLSSRISLRKNNNKKNLLEKIGIGVIVFILLVQIILISIIPFTDAFLISKKYIENNKEILEEVGHIEGFGLIPTGAIQKTTDTDGTYGSATINLTIKGQNKFKDVTVYVAKYVDKADWTVEGID